MVLKKVTHSYIIGMSVFSLKHIKSQPLQKKSKNETMEWVFILEVEALVLKDKSIFYELHK